MLRSEVSKFTKVTMALVLWGLFSFSAFALPHSAASELPLAFITGIGLSCCIFIIGSAMFSRVEKNQLLILTLSLIALCFSVEKFTASDVNLVLAVVVIYTMSSFFWVKRQFDSKNRRTFLALGYIALLLSAGGLISLIMAWVSPSLIWLAYILMFSLLFAAVLYWRDTCKHAAFDIRIKLLMTMVYATLFIFYMWLVQAIDHRLVSFWLVISMLVWMEYGFWHARYVTKCLSSATEQPSVDTTVVSYDPVTNLPIYHCALSVFERYLLQHHQAPCVAIVFKPTNFQQVNTILGHKNSDMLLLQLSYCLQQAVANDQRLVNFSQAPLPAIRIARLQGLHFLLLLDLQDNQHPENIVIEQLCSELKSSVPKAMNFKSFSLHFQLAFGVAFLTQGDSSASETIACAEDALLIGCAEQKEINYFQEHYAVFNQKQLQRMEQLKHDIQHDLMQWFVQPQVTIANKQLVGFELVGYWQEKEQKLSSSSIVTLAEQSGDIYQLTKLQLCHAMKFINMLNEQGYQLAITVKLTSLNVLEFELVEFIEQQLQQHDLMAKQLILEIKESLLFSSPQQAQKIIAQLKANGIQIAIGGFSGSYEALRYLRKLAIDQVKIDCSLLSESQDNNSDKAIVNALINLIRTMELPLIATEVNNLSTEEALIAMGAVFVQGKLYHAGLNLDNLASWLSAWQKQYNE